MRTLVLLVITLLRNCKFHTFHLNETIILISVHFVKKKMYMSVFYPYCLFIVKPPMLDDLRYYRILLKAD